MRLEATLDEIHTGKRSISISWLKYVGLVGLCFVVYFPTFYNGFQLEWDDQWMLINHELVLNPNWDNIWYYLTNYVDRQYFPLNQLYYLGIFELFGFNPTTYHLGSLIIHCSNTLMVYALVQKVVTIIGKNQEVDPFVIALGTAILFSLHPLQVEAVAWISASKVLWYGFFTLGCLLLYLRYLNSGRRMFLILVALGYGLGFMCKEQMIILPLLLVLFDLFLNQQQISAKRLLLEKIPFFLIAFIFWYGAARNGLGLAEAGGYPLGQRLALGSYCFTTYLFRFLAPVGLLHFYDFPIRSGDSLPLIYYSYLVLVPFAGYGIYDIYKRQHKVLLFAILFFCINLVLVLHLVPSPRTYMAADRYMYLPIIGMCMILCWTGYKLWNKIKYKSLAKYAGFLVVSACMLILGVQAHEMTKNWKDSVVLKQEIVDHLNQKGADAK